MRIAVWHNLPSGGGKRALYDHVRGLLKFGHEVEVWCPPTANRDFLPLASLAPEHLVPLKWDLPQPLMNKLYIERSIASMNAHCRRCAGQIDAGGFDVLLANSCQFFRTNPIGRYARVPALLYLQEPYRRLYEALPRLPWIAPPVDQFRAQPSRWPAQAANLLRLRNWRIIAREELDNAAAFKRILVNSYFSRESVLRAYGLDSEVCYLGIDTDYFRRTAHGARENFVVGLGSITPAKNLELVVEALGAVAPPRPRLVWIGNTSDSDYREKVIQLARMCSVDLELRVAVHDDSVIDLLSRALVLVYAPRLEPFGLAPLEAGSCELPVIGVREGGMRETIQHNVNGLLVDAVPSAIASAISTLRDNPELARKLGVGGRRLAVDQWSVDGATSRLEQKLLEHSTVGRISQDA